MGHGVNIFLPSPPNYVTRSPGLGHVVGEKEAEGSGDENGSNSSVGIIKCYLMDFLPWLKLCAFAINS